MRSRQLDTAVYYRLLADANLHKKQYAQQVNVGKCCRRDKRLLHAKVFAMASPAAGAQAEPISWLMPI
jgi:hypothetical protein